MLRFVWTNESIYEKIRHVKPIQPSRRETTYFPLVMFLLAIERVFADNMTDINPFSKASLGNSRVFKRGLRDLLYSEDV